jgi:hypothetical protein
MVEVMVVLEVLRADKIVQVAEVEPADIVETVEMVALDLLMVLLVQVAVLAEVVGMICILIQEAPLQQAEGVWVYMDKALMVFEEIRVELKVRLLLAEVDLAALMV